MRKIVYIISFVVAILFTSCNDFLDTPSPSNLDESTIFSNPLLASRAISGILEPMGQTNSYRGRYLPYYGTNTDIEWYNSSEQTTTQAELAKYEVTPTNVYMNTTNNAWQWMYTGIERANLCIRGIRTYGDPQPGNEMGQMLGEAIALRALYYADLLKAWGDVVARFEPVSSETIYLPKTDRGVIYKQIIADLDEAADLVGWPNENARTSTSEGVNKAFVRALRARVCLAAAGYAQYPDGIRRSTDPELSVANLYPIALQECKDIIESGKARLESTFETLFKKNCQEDISAGGESLWEIPFADGRGRHVYTFGIQHRAADQYTLSAGGGSAGPLPFVYYDFDEKDTRRDITCVPYEWSNANPSKQVIRSLKSWCFGKWRYEWMKRKAAADDGINKIYIRYAEVLLMAAEIENELNGASAAAPYLKEIRKRAFKPEDWSEKVDAYVDALSGKEQMFDAIVKEQGYEFCGEMERKNALIRWNLLGAKMAEAKLKMNDLRNHTGEYADVPTTIYYKYAADGETLQFYGLNRGETEDMSGSYPNVKVWIAPDEINDLKLNSLYTVDPDTRQFWPIWQVFLDASNGSLNNDYGY